MLIEPFVMLMDIQHTEELLTNEVFLAWYYQSDKEKAGRFEAWMRQHPERSALVAEASRLLSTIRVQEPVVTAEQTQAAVHELNKAIDTQPVLIGRSGMPLWRWMTAAAAVVVLVMAGFGIRDYLSRSTVRMPYGEIGEQLLPDGSQVTLNANTRLTYYKWKTGQDREVWVKGEAYFQVKKTPERSRFIVHTSRFDIIVTGTKFNVVNRGDRANVLLKEGSVIIHPHTSEAGPGEIYMRPGDFVEYNAHQLKKMVRNDAKIIAWKDKKLVFENTSIREMASTIEEHYGVTVIVGDKALLSRTITGMLPNDNLDVLLQALEATGEYVIERRDDSIVLKAHP